MCSQFNVEHWPGDAGGDIICITGHRSVFTCHDMSSCSADGRICLRFSKNSRLAQENTPNDAHAMNCGGLCRVCRVDIYNLHSKWHFFITSSFNSATNGSFCHPPKEWQYAR